MVLGTCKGEGGRFLSMLARKAFQSADFQLLISFVVGELKKESICYWMLLVGDGH